jgi:hypothetical protein
MIATEPQDPLDELEHENEVAVRLVERLGEFALSLNEGKTVSPGEIAEGLRLWEQYRHLHAHRFDDVLLPEARQVAMSTCFPHLDAVVRDHGEIDHRVDRSKAALQAYSQGEPDGAQRLATELDSLTQAGYVGMRYEGDYPLSCLRTALTEDGSHRVGLEFSGTSTEVTDLEHHIVHYLEQTPSQPDRRFPIHCQGPGCSSTSSAEEYPADRGYFGIRPPTGWKAVPHAPRSVGSEKVVVDIDFFCPEHAAGGANSVVVPSRTPTTKLPMVPAGRSDAHERAGSCCDPVPENLA